MKKGVRAEIALLPLRHQMKGFTPTAASNGFSHDLLWSGLRPGLPAIALAQPRRAGCHATKSHRSRSKSAKLSGAARLHEIS